MAGGSDALAAMRHRDFKLFWSAALLSNTGTWMQTITVPFVLDQLTHSTVWVGVGAFCTFFPATIVGPLAGSLADRYSRRSVLLWAQTLMMVGAFTLWGIWVSGVATPQLIVACVTVCAIGAGITVASWQAFVPQLVPPEAMLSAVRLNSMQFTGARAFGPALAGLVLAQFGPGTAFLANGLSFLLVIGALFLIPARPVADGGVGGSVLRHFREGMRYVGDRPVLVLAVLGALLSSLLGVSVIQLAEPFARQVLHVNAGKYGLLVGAYGAGAILGSIVTVARGDRFRRSRLTLVGFGLFVAGEIAFGLAPGYAVALCGLFVIGLAQVLAMVSSQTAVQVNVDERYRGRALSIYVMCFFAGTPIGALIGGIAAEVIGLRATVIGAAVLLALSVGVLFVKFRGFQVLDESTTGLDRTAATA
ncbi:MAG: MFS transporter, partial [Acidimicrobiia bacterium]